MKYLFTLVNLLLVVCVANAQDEMEIEIQLPDGWVLTDTGIAKGSNELSIGPILELGEVSAVDYLITLADVPIDNTEILSVGEIKDGNLVVQVVRELNTQDKKARSTLFICKEGRNQHRLLELYTEDVFSVIAGGKAAIEFCSQN